MKIRNHKIVLRIDFVLWIALEREILIFAVRHAPASVAPPVKNVRLFETFVEVVENVAKHSLNFFLNKKNRIFKIIEYFAELAELGTFEQS